MELNLPSYQHKVKHENGKAFIFDAVRKKYVSLTPEEWVRQHLVSYLVEHLHYPKGLISVESGLKYHSLSKRSDILVYERNMQPLLLVECKSFKVKLDDRVFEQSAIYNQALKAPYLMISNGLVHYCCRMDYQKGSYTFLEELPAYDHLCGS
jgi:hypothetical protein